MSNTTKDFISSIQTASKEKTSAYDSTATVKRIEGGTAWVHIPGGVDETPVAMTMNAKEGDSVQVRVSNGRAFLVGNATSPPTDDTTAEAAKALANRAAEDAGRAKTAADIAESYATSAQASAAQSANILEGMEQAAIAAGTTLDGIYADAAEAKATTDEINDYADTAGKTVTQILNDGETAGAAASAAQQAADTALVNLATTEDVVGVLNWITAHGTMVSQYGEVFDPDKVYFIVDPAGDYVVSGTHYSVVPSPVAEDIDSYYILNISESVQNYVATHIVVDSEGLWIIPDAGGNKVLIATGSGSTYTTAGTYIVGKVNGVDTVLAEFTASGVVIGDAAGAHTSIDEDGMQIYSVDSNDNLVELANIGYGQGISEGGTAIAPYYTFGIRRPGFSVGNYSVAEGSTNVASEVASHAEGRFTEASGVCSHAEGSFTKASDYYDHAEGFDTEASGTSSHAEGYNTTASGVASHAEGIDTFATGYYTHAEGRKTTASGDYSHSQNNYTIAQRKSQTALGEYNTADTTGADGTVRGSYALIIGNGTADNARSNALTVDWSGNVNISSGAKYKINGTNLSASDVGALAEDANGDISITRNITAGGNVEAAGDVTDGAGNTLSAVAASVPVIAVETKTLGTNVNVSANSNSPSYNIPSKTGYTVAAVTPIVTGGYNGHYFAAITSSNNSIPTSLYFKNTHSSAHTNSFYIRVVYIKN